MWAVPVAVARPSASPAVHASHIYTVPTPRRPVCVDLTLSRPVAALLLVLLLLLSDHFCRRAKGRSRRTLVVAYAPHFSTLHRAFHNKMDEVEQIVLVIARPAHALTLRFQSALQTLRDSCSGAWSWSSLMSEKPEMPHPVQQPLPQQLASCPSKPLPPSSSGTS